MDNLMRCYNFKYWKEEDVEMANKLIAGFREDNERDEAEKAQANARNNIGSGRANRSANESPGQATGGQRYGSTRGIDARRRQQYEEYDGDREMTSMHQSLRPYGYDNTSQAQGGRNGGSLQELGGRHHNGEIRGPMMGDIDLGRLTIDDEDDYEENKQVVEHDYQYDVVAQDFHHDSDTLEWHYGPVAQEFYHGALSADDERQDDEQDDGHEGHNWHHDVAQDFYYDAAAQDSADDEEQDGNSQDDDSQDDDSQDDDSQDDGYDDFDDGDDDGDDYDD